MTNMNALPTHGVLKLEEPLEFESPLYHFPELDIFADTPVRIGPIKMVDHPILFHLDKVIDHVPPAMGSPDSHASIHSDESGVPSDGSTTPLGA
jgi:hypothetical protein